MAIECDVAVIGGGPAASTLGTLLRKYDPNLSVLLLEREVFPRDHVGESQIPHLMPILDEMQVWDKVEAANFPIKVGGLYKWGSSDELWSLDFIPVPMFREQPRPGKFSGQRLLTAFQVDRSIYDKILLDHARDAGCTVMEGVKVVSIGREGDRVTGLEVSVSDPSGVAKLAGETQVRAGWYVDASGNSGILRRAMDVDVDSPTALRNIAVYDYWQNTEWAERIGVGGTRILTLSLECGWLWFIPLGPTRTSIGLVVPADYLTKTGKKPAELYLEAVMGEPTISKLVANATREKITQTTKDWSFVAHRLFGENWFLAGDAAGFADPILSAGLTLAQSGSRSLAYTILEINRGEHDQAWLKKCYEKAQTARIRNHIRFADFWYSSNGHFTELKEYCAEIARGSGVKVTPEEAFVWMGSGGFANDNLGVAGAGTYTISALKYNIHSLTGKAVTWKIAQFNRYRLNLDGAEVEDLASYDRGRIHRVSCFTRGPLVLPDYLAYGAMYAALQVESDLDALLDRYVFEARKRGLRTDYVGTVRSGLEVLEAMIAEGWVMGEDVPEGRHIGCVQDPHRAYLHVGWIEPGIGLTSVDPGARGSVVLPWLDCESALAGQTAGPAAPSRHANHRSG
ncbi:MAG: NAD(P)/FAD-dependent oxidoreductase [Fimbriimonadaceae bacterium]